MTDLRTQIYNNLNIKETEELLEIWQEQDTDEWRPEVFEIIEQILARRLGYTPSRELENSPSSIPEQNGIQDEVGTAIQHAERRVAASHVLRRVGHNLQVRNLGQALKDCDAAVELAPDLADAYILRGQVYEELGQPQKALIDYAEALRLDPESDAAWVYLATVEEDLDEQFQRSSAKRGLDRAVEFALDDEPDKALDEIEFALRDLPAIAPAYTCLGSIYAELGRWEMAAEAFQEAIRLNPRCYDARQKLAAVNVQLEAELYRQAVTQNDVETADEIGPLKDEAELLDAGTGGSEADAEDGEPLPGWVYLGEKEFVLSGWPGHRNRPGRSGYDPLETDFEQAHVTGVIIRQLLTLKFRTRNPVYLLIMTVLGLMFCAPLLAVVNAIGIGEWIRDLIVVSVALGPFLLLGIGLLLNVILSIFTLDSETHE